MIIKEYCTSIKNHFIKNLYILFYFLNKLKIYQSTYDLIMDQKMANIDEYMDPSKTISSGFFERNDIYHHDIVELISFYKSSNNNKITLNGNCERPKANFINNKLYIESEKYNKNKHPDHIRFFYHKREHIVEIKKQIYIKSKNNRSFDKLGEIEKDEKVLDFIVNIHYNHFYLLTNKKIYYINISEFKLTELIKLDKSDYSIGKIIELNFEIGLMIIDDLTIQYYYLKNNSIKKIYLINHNKKYSLKNKLIVLDKKSHFQVINNKNILMYKMIFSEIKKINNDQILGYIHEIKYMNRYYLITSLHSSK